MYVRIDFFWVAPRFSFACDLQCRAFDADECWKEMRGDVAENMAKSSWKFLPILIVSQSPEDNLHAGLYRRAGQPVRIVLDLVGACEMKRKGALSEFLFFREIDAFDFDRFKAIKP
jgi:hypothetical protein